MSFSQIGLIAAIPAVITALFMPLLGFSSDRREERLWHVSFPLLLAAFGWLLIIVFNAPLVQLAGLIAVSSGSYGALAIFWTIPASAAVLSPRAHPAGIALINSIGNAGAGVGSFVVGAFAI
jgi:ACS family 4-hydroxyphenylacetate permease-like MFS transporter